MYTRTTRAAPGRLSLSVRIIAGLVLGVFTGLFFGEPAAVLQPVADIYIRLMQMTVLPYLVMSLIIGFGQLEAGAARRLAVRAGMLLLLVWVLSFAVIAAMPAAFPVMQSASFFSNALIEPTQPFSIADLYFTSKPFHSLSNAVIPAVVLFSSMIGIGLIGLEDRERVLGTLRVLNASIIRITRFIIGLTPIGVFAIGAVAAGTMTPETFAQLEVYFITFGAASLLLAFLVLPLLVTALTPFRYAELISNSPDTNDLPEISLVGRGYYKDLLSVDNTPEAAACKNAGTGLRIWEWTGKAMDEASRSQGTMHSKFAVIDGERSLVGSYNLDPRSEKLNSETAVVFLDPELSQQLRRMFLDNDLKYSREVTPEMAAEFEAPDDVIIRFRKSIGHLFEEQL